jgi:hypothetical protein
MKRILLTKGKFALVDDVDFDRLSKHKWFVHSRRGKFYAARGRNPTISMHVEIFGNTCDHKNRNSLDNRRNNLRAATHQEQCCNRGVRKDNKSGFKGVCWHKQSEKWRTQVRIFGKMVYCKDFSSKKEAARAYDAAAQKFHGEFAVLNFPKNSAANQSA